MRTYFGYLVPLVDYLSQDNDEAVVCVEAIPFHIHLLGLDVPATFNVQQAFLVGLVGHNLLKAGGDSTFLWRASEDE